MVTRTAPDQIGLGFTIGIDTWLDYEMGRRRSPSSPSTKGSNGVNWKAIEEAFERYRKSESTGRAVVNPETYREFVSQGRQYYYGDDEYPDRDYFHRLDLLTSFFPQRFGPGGSQDLEQKQYDNYQMFGLFRKMINYAEEHMGG